METNRLEAFSDGVIAIIITIMVLEMKVPHGAHVSALAPLAPVFLSYVLSFVYVGIYWNNHHHMLQLTETVSGAVLWANLHLLFWLSLLPFTTGWMGENHFERWPAVFYGVNLLCCAVAYYVLQTCLIRNQGQDGLLAMAVAKDFKGKASPVLYVCGILAAWTIAAWVGMGFFVFVALMWLIPDRRVERVIDRKSNSVVPKLLRLLDREPRNLCQFRDAIVVRAYEAGEFLGRGGCGFGALSHELFFHVRRAQRFYDSCIELGDDRSRRASRYHHTCPSHGEIPRQPGLSSSRHIRQGDSTLVTAHGQRPQTARAHVRQRRAD